MDEIMALLEGHAGAMELYEIAEALNRNETDVSARLDALTGEGAVMRTKKGKYLLTKDAGLVSARTMVLRSGACVARPLDGGADLFIHEPGALSPMLDDIILVRPEPNLGSHGDACRLMAIAKRAHEQFLAVMTARPRRGGARHDEEARYDGRSRQEQRARHTKKDRRSAPPGQADRTLTARPVDPRFPADIQLAGDLMGAHAGDLVMLRVTRWPERGAMLRAAVACVMGEADDIHAQLRGIVARRKLREAFPPDVLRQAEGVPDRVGEADLTGCADLRGLTLFTIDGEDAQDFDDAVSLEMTPNGVRLGVHIADVSHYVRPGTPIDREAVERGTSVYLPGMTLPMLPESLSNRMCSLMPDTDRLAMSLLMDLRDGAVADHTLAPSVIHSRARLTYDQVNRMLDGQPSDVPETLHDTLRRMVGVAQVLRARRHARGSIDFDMPEAAFTLDAEGRPTDVRARSRGEAERMIEDFMLLANETVALLARTTELPFLYRVHASPDPDRVRSLELFLGGLGIKARLGGNPQPSKYQKILADNEDKPEAGLVKQMMLRSLKRAEYAPEPEGHFGLAARDYCHFTSPIRRYPDLTVHRMLKLLLSGGETAPYAGTMPDLARQCSACEQKATLAERDADDLIKAHYMAGHIGETFPGIVTGVTAWGVYVTLANTAEGLVPLRTLPEAYHLDPERHTLHGPGGRAIRLGDAVRVTVERVSTALAQIDFALEG